MASLSPTAALFLYTSAQAEGRAQHLLIWSFRTRDTERQMLRLLYTEAPNLMTKGNSDTYTGKSTHVELAMCRDS